MLEPSSASQTTAARSRQSSRAAHLSTQSYATFSRPPTNHVAHSIPADVSRTFVYGVENSMPQKRTNSSQNHSGSAIERARRSAKLLNPCSAMNRPTLLVDACSTVGLHTARDTAAEVTGACA